jgi:multidrug efflux pump subunit AcrB
VTHTPQSQLDSLDTLRNIPVIGDAGTQPQILGAISSIKRGVGPAVETHYDVAPTIDIYATTQDRDLGSVAADVQKLVDVQKDLPRGSSAATRGQVLTMNSSFIGLPVYVLSSASPRPSRTWG